jgi:hypothetical protein
MPPYSFEGCRLPRLRCCAENVPDEDQWVVPALEPRALPRRGHQCTTIAGSSSRRSASSSPRPSLIFLHSSTKASPGFDVDVRLLGQEVSDHAHVYLGLLLPHESDGLGSESIEVGFQGLKELSAQAISCAFWATLGIPTLTWLEAKGL